jgi:hypothetical protein
MIADKPYCEWFAAQAWASEKHPEIVRFIQEGEQGGNETPEHNRIQAMFLELDVRNALIKICGGNPEKWIYHKVDFENSGIDVLIHPQFSEPFSGRFFAIEVKPHVSDDYPVVIRQVRSKQRKNDAGRWVVYTESVSSQAVTEWQMREMFRLAGIWLVTKEELDTVLGK